MPDAPAAEILIDEPLVRRLLLEQGAAVPGSRSDALVLADEGWDNQVWRLGSGWALRLPRRAAAARLIEYEQRWLPVLAPPITAASGLALPDPVVRGVPSSTFPWAWTVAPWIDGEPGLAVPRSRRRAWAVPLARALRALHRPAPPDHPVNPFRGVPLAARDDDVRARIAQLAVPHLTAEATAALEAWEAAVSAPPWSDGPLWIHGDLHPGNLVARDDRLVGILDFGDLTAGDPAYDLAAAWLAFDRCGREEFVAAVDVTAASTWTRARGWAAAMAAMLVAHSDDRPAYRHLGLAALRELL